MRGGCSMWQPMLLTEAPATFNDARWVWQVKWDGVRCGITCSNGHIRLLSRTGKDMTTKFPEVVADLAASIGQVGAVLDGELICLTEGKPDFYAVMSRLQGSGGKVESMARTRPATFMAFDILHVAGHDCTHRPLVDRQATLAKHITPSDHVQIIDSWPGTSGQQVADAVAKMGLEGVVGKRKESVYRPGVRSRDWVKVKFWQRTEVVILGVRQRPFSAVVGDTEGHVLCSVSLGLTPSHQRELWSAIPHLRLRDEGGVTWLRPVLRGQLRYRTNPTGIIREPVFEGIVTSLDV
jgi:ATP-dependent DNA ligase